MATSKENRERDVLGLILRIVFVVFLFVLILCIFKTCWDCSRDNARLVIVKKTGYLPEKENWDSIPDIEPPYKDEDLDSLPDKVSLEAFFPPIGNQNPYGTCVAWALGYNLKTALNAIDNKWTKVQLENPAYQTSPKDLFLGIPQAEKGDYDSKCNGTALESAFRVLINKGVANMEKVPYANVGNCTGVAVGDTTNVLLSFNRVVSSSNLPTVEQIKAYLKDTVPLAISARLGDNFMEWRSDDVIKSDTYLQPGMMHAYHAMVLSGYDDSKHAFRVRNSWGTAWGDEGSIWVDYDFFMNSFCEAVFVAQNGKVPNIASAR